MAGNDDLHKPLKAINQTLGRIRENIDRLIGEVEKVHTAITDGVETIRDAIQESIQAQAELKLMEHVMEAKSVKPQIDAEHDQIETEREELDERLESIDDRYQRKHEELDEKAADRVRDLGSHIFAVQEDQFEDGIEMPFTEGVTTTWQTLQSHNDDVREERREQVQGTVGNVVQTIHDFIDRQSELVEDIDSHRIDEARIDQTVRESGRLQVPYYVVEYEEDGVAKSQLVAPSHVTSAEDGEWSSVQLSSISGASDLLDGVGTPRDGHPDPTASRDITRNLEAYSASSALGPSYVDAVESALPDEVPVTVEGGAD